MRWGERRQWLRRQRSPDNSHQLGGRGQSSNSISNCQMVQMAHRVHVPYVSFDYYKLNQRIVCTTDTLYGTTNGTSPDNSHGVGGLSNSLIVKWSHGWYYWQTLGVTYDAGIPVTLYNDALYTPLAYIFLEPNVGPQNWRNWAKRALGPNKKAQYQVKLCDNRESKPSWTNWRQLGPNLAPRDCLQTPRARGWGKICLWI